MCLRISSALAETRRFEYHATATILWESPVLSEKRVSSADTITVSPTARVAAGAFLISFSPVFVKVVDVGPSAAALYRLLIGGIVLTAAALIKGHWKRLQPKAWLLAGVCGVIVALDLSVWHVSIQIIGPGLATVLGNHQIFVLTAFGLLFLGERLTLRLAVAILLAMLGLFLIFGLEWGEFNASYRLGVACSALTAVLYATFLLVLRHVQSGPNAPEPVVTVAIISIVGAAVLAGYVGIGKETFAVASGTTWSLLAAYAIVCHVIGWVLISTGLPGLTASRAGLLLLLQPALAFVWDVVLFDRPTAGIEVVGAVLALVAIYLGTGGHEERPTSS